MAKILIADDSPTLRRIVASVLRRDGHEVVEAQDGIAAVQAVLRHRPDAVVLDVQMPRVSGFIAARLLKDDPQTAGLPLVMLTSLDTASDRYWAAEVGADRFLTKNFEATELAGTVTEVLAESAARARGPAAEPVEVSEQDVLARVCDLLDRKLFESSVAQSVTAIATSAHGVEQSVAALLSVLQRFVDYDLAGVLLAGERVAYVAVGAPTSTEHYADFLQATCAGLAGSAAELGELVEPGELVVRLAHAGGTVVDDVDDLPGGAQSAGLAALLSVPLRGHGGAVVGLVAISTSRAFSETAVSTLRVLEGPAGLVLDGARLAAGPVLVG